MTFPDVMLEQPRAPPASQYNHEQEEQLLLSFKANKERALLF